VTFFLFLLSCDQPAAPNPGVKWIRLGQPDNEILPEAAAECPQEVLKASQDSSELDMSDSGRQAYGFGPFRVDPGRRLLLRGDQVVPLQPKALDTLLVLVQNSGRLLSKEELMKSVWVDSFVEESNLTQNIFVLRKVLEEAGGGRGYIVTVPGRGYRFAEPVRVIPEEREKPEEAIVASNSQSPVVIEHTKLPIFRRRWKLVVGAAVLLSLAAGGYRYFPRTPRLTGKDTIVLADFANMTGDPVFDSSLRLGLAAQLEQSPFLNLLPDQSITQTLSLMAQPRDSQLTEGLAREVCLRTGGAAVLNGVIAQVGTRYLLVLNASACSNGKIIASAQAQAPDKNHVLDALGAVATGIRGKLGEAMASIERYDAPPENVTTASLEALEAYSAGYKAMIARNDYPGAITFFQHAIELDTRFAMAYARLGINFYNQDQPARAAEFLEKAFELRGQLSEREKLYITASREAMDTGDMEAARKAYEAWAEMYPRDQFAIGNLGVVYDYLGEYGKEHAALQEAWKLNPKNALVLANIVSDYTHLNRTEEALATAREAQARHLESNPLHSNLYFTYFLRRDAAGMEREAAALLGKPGWDDLMLHFQSDTAAYAGQFAKARELTRRAVASAQRADKREAAAAYEAESAVREALTGNPGLARLQARSALALSDDREAGAMATFALALAGSSADTRRMADDLNRRFPKNTVVQFNALPIIRAAVALRAGQASKAIELLAVPYELGQASASVTFALYPIYLRGESYLAANQPLAASGEFQKVLNYPGLVQNQVIGPLSHLGLARAHALSGNPDTARSAYQDFLASWKDADPDIPVLADAHAGYAKLGGKR
jgi:eukaryotic-like serine/threonine-protein kinase